MKYKCGLMRTLNLNTLLYIKIYFIGCVIRNRITYPQSSKLPEKEENKLLQDPKIDSHVLTVQKFVLHSAAEFLCERKFSTF